MEIKDSKIKNVTVITVEGSLDALTAPSLAEYVSKKVNGEEINIVVDFSGVDYTSSAGLRALLGATKETRAQSGDLRLAALQPDVEKVLTISGFTSILKVFDDVDAAVSSYL